MDRVLWLRLRSSGFKGIWWPCKVLESIGDRVELESFADNVRYEALSSGEEVRPFKSSQDEEFVQIAKKRLRNKPSTLKLFIDGVSEATQCLSNGLEGSSVDPPVSTASSPTDAQSVKPALQTRSCSVEALSKPSELQDSPPLVKKELKEPVLDSKPARSSEPVRTKRRHSSSSVDPPAKKVCVAQDDEEAISSDEELPPVRYFDTDLEKIDDFKATDIVWVKRGHYPFWPAIVVRGPSGKGSKKAIKVRFFGFTDLDQMVKIRNCKKVAVFNCNRNAEFQDIGQTDKLANYFELALDDVHRLTKLRLEGQAKETADEQYKQITSTRTTENNHVKNPLLDVMETSTFDYYNSSSDEECGNYSSSEGEEDSEDYQYNYPVVSEAVKSLKEELVAIAQGKSPSRRHQLYVTGEESAINKMKRLESTFGPLRAWTTRKRVAFIKELEEMLASYNNFQVKITHDYVLSVILPEALIRVIIKLHPSNDYTEAEKLFNSLDYKPNAKK